MSSQDYFCYFCNETAISSGQTVSSSDDVTKFIKLLGRYTGKPELDLLLIDKIADIVFSCCNECRKIFTDFCEMYHQLKLLKFKIDLKLEKLVGKLQHATQMPPSRCPDLNQLLKEDENSSSDLLTRRNERNVINELQQNIVIAVERKLLKFQPRVFLEKLTGIQIQPIEKLELESNPNCDLTDDTDVDLDGHIGFLRDYRAVMDIPEEEQEENMEFSETEVFSQEFQEKYQEDVLPPETEEYDATVFEERQFITPDKNGDIEDKDELKENDTENLNLSLFPTNQKVKRPKRKRNLKRIGYENRFYCKKCQKPFPALTHLRRHVNTKFCVKKKKTEAGNGHFPCPECGKNFTALSLLTIHLEYHKKPDEWKWECSECGKKCVTKSNLDIHLRRHTKEKPFSCQVCGKKYGYNISLKYHLNKSHGNDGIGGAGSKKK